MNVDEISKLDLYLGERAIKIFSNNAIAISPVTGPFKSYEMRW